MVSLHRIATATLTKAPPNLWCLFYHAKQTKLSGNGDIVVCFVFQIDVNNPEGQDISNVTLKHGQHRLLNNRKQVIDPKGSSRGVRIEEGKLLASAI